MKTLKRILRLYAGSSFPVEVELTTGERCVMKMRGAGNGPTSLLAELVVSRIAGAAGFPVPRAFPVLIPEAFPWEFGTDEFDDLLQRSYGENLGLELVEGAIP